jgi:hypothetical protein
MRLQTEDMFFRLNVLYCGRLNTMGKPNAELLASLANQLQGLYDKMGSTYIGSKYRKPTTLEALTFVCITGLIGVFFKLALRTIGRC